jgi:hypothetical protein
MAGIAVYSGRNAAAASKRELYCQRSTGISDENKYNQRMSSKGKETKVRIRTAVKEAEQQRRDRSK